ncbi:MAG: hypothetical protein JJT94_08875 [Bernardetiaceae bacterium]|nr:hypothetical protein [Bernardetiaceae bacterium]
MNYSFEDYFDLSTWDRPQKSNQKAIPSQVFANHFEALARHLKQDDLRYALKKVPFFEKKIQYTKEINIKKLRDLLFNAWSTEYLLRAHVVRKDTAYQKLALHWTFPQVYYSAYLCMYAFFLCKKTSSKTHDALIKQFATLVEHKAYPEVICFYATGEMKNFECHNLPDYKPLTPNKVLSKIENKEEVSAQIASFLCSTRKQKARQLKEEKQQHARSALKNAKGEPLKSFRTEHWRIITDKMSITTIFDLLYRLRIKANYQSVDTFLNADIDFQFFYQNLYEVVAYLNFVHESYIAKSIGIRNFKAIVQDFPQLSQDRFLDTRLKYKIEPLFANA